MTGSTTPDPVALLLDAQRHDASEANRIVGAAVSAAETAAASDADELDIATAVVDAIAAAKRPAAPEAEDLPLDPEFSDDHELGAATGADSGDDLAVHPSDVALAAASWSSPAAPPQLPAGAVPGGGEPPWDEDHPASANRGSTTAMPPAAPAPTAPNPDVDDDDETSMEDTEATDEDRPDTETDPADATFDHTAHDSPVDDEPVDDEDPDFIPGVSPLDQTPWGAAPAVEIRRDDTSTAPAVNEPPASAVPAAEEPTPSTDGTVGPTDRPTAEPTPLSTPEKLWRSVSGAAAGTLSRIPRIWQVVLGFTAMIVVLFLVLAMCGPKKEAPAEPQASAAPGPATTTKPSTAQDIDLFLEMATISSNCNPAVSTDPRNAFRPPDSDAWICSRDLNADSGSVVNITFKRPVVISRIEIVPGFDYDKGGTDQWTRHRVVTAITWRAGNKLWPQQTTGSREASVFEMPNVATPAMSGTITASERPKTDPSGRKGLDLTQGGGKDAITPEEVDKTTAIQSIRIFGHVAGDTNQERPRGIGP